jgi:hypothetical protein
MLQSGPDLAAVRSEVRSLLERTPAFFALGAEEQRNLANAMVRVGAYLSADPRRAGAPRWAKREPAPARAMAEPGQT